MTYAKRRRLLRRLRWILLAALSTPVLAADETTCLAITSQRPQARPIGRCYADGRTLCSADVQCTKHSKDYCVHGVLRDRTTAACHSGPDCIESITFSFDKPYGCGQFADGSWWVLADSTGRVQLTDISPRHTPGCEPGGSGACLHGWDVDQRAKTQSQTSRTGPFKANTPALPYLARVSTQPLSILKGIDNRLPGGIPSNANSLLYAAVLTIVPTAPPGDALRPPWAGPSKPPRYYRTSEIDLSKIPKLPRVGPGGGLELTGGFSLSDIATAYSVPWLGSNIRNNRVEKLHSLYQSYLGKSSSSSSVTGYHAGRAGRTNDALLRTMIDDTDYAGSAAHRLALFRLIQFGLDMSWIAKNWDAQAGNRRRLKNMAVPILFAAHLLGERDIADTGFPGFSEQDTFILSPRTGGGVGLVLWGYSGCTEETYWQQVNSGAGDKWCGDPYGYGDQNWFAFQPATSSYQKCCSSKPWKGGALAVQLMQMRGAGMDLEPFLAYEDRFVSFGLHHAPDPCAGPPGTFGVDYGPAPGNTPDCHMTGSCECIKHGGDPMAEGRMSRAHATGRDSGTWGRSYANEMWSAFRRCASPELPDGSLAPDFPCPGMLAPTEHEPIASPPAAPVLPD